MKKAILIILSLFFVGCVETFAKPGEENTGGAGGMGGEGGSQGSDEWISSPEYTLDNFGGTILIKEDGMTIIPRQSCVVIPGDKINIIMPNTIHFIKKEDFNLDEIYVFRSNNYDFYHSNPTDCDFEIKVNDSFGVRIEGSTVSGHLLHSVQFNGIDKHKYVIFNKEVNKLEI